jgi:quercetin dioxygenase-like cupin family protein
MMKRIGIVVGLTLAVGIALGVIGLQILSAQGPITRTELMKTDLEGIEGEEVKVAVIEWAPGAVSGKHYHPEYEFAYMVEGSLIVEPEGQTPVTFGPGQVIYNPLNRVHVAKNASTTESVKMVQFIISKKGQPALVPVK